MRILLLNYEFPPLGGGGGVFSKDLALELAKEHTIDVVTSAFGNLPKEESLGNISIYRVPVLFRTSLHYATMLSMLSFPVTGTLKALKLCSKNKYDIINTHFAVPTGPAGEIVSSIKKIPNVLSVHGTDIYNPARKISPYKYAPLRWCVRRVLNNADKVIAQSTDLKQYAETIYKPNKTVEIITLGMPEPNIPQNSKQDIGLPQDKFCLVSIGRMAKVKGYDVLLKALDILKKESHDIHLTLIGDGPELENLKEMTSSLSLEDQVTFTGWLSNEEKYKYLSASDLYVMSSLHEGFGIVLLEAMFAGLPIIATDAGGQVDIIEDGRNGKIVPAARADALAKAVTSLLEDKNKLKSMANNNLEDAKRFSIENVAKQYESLFKKTYN